jgi:hypothetical protein
MKKIIHLSDLHVGHEDCGVKFRALIDNITFLKQPAKNKKKTTLDCERHCVCKTMRRMSTV